MESLPDKEQAYIKSLCQIVKDVVGENNVVGVYLFGSASQGSYIVGKSDLDIQVVTYDLLSEDKKQKLARALSHKNLPCPATKLEFVVYNIQSLQRFETISYNINLNTGREVDEHCSFDDSEDPWFWFVLDIAIGRVKGLTLWGKSNIEVFPEIPAQVIDKAMLECMEWFLANYPEDSGCYECAERCYVYLETGEMVSKTSARSYMESLGCEVGDVRHIVVNKLKIRV